MRKSEIGKLHADDLRNDLGIEPNTPIDLTFITECLAIKVVHRALGNDIEGACKSRGINRLIVLKPHALNRQTERFTLSHEIGHLLMHRMPFTCKTDCFSTYRTQNEKEQEANDFAAELLLPRRVVVENLDRNGLSYSTISQISDQYDTSLTVAAIKFTQLFKHSAALIWHDGTRVIWQVRSETCKLKIINHLDENALCRKTSESSRYISRIIEASDWIENEIEDLQCEEETLYLPKLKQYLSILKFYEDD